MSARLAVVAGALALACCAGAAAATPAHAAGEPARLRDHFTSEEIARAARYRGPRYALELASLAVTIAALGIAAFAAGRRIGSWSHAASGGRWWLQALVLVAAVSVGVAALQLPFDVARFLHDRRFGLVTQSVAGRLGDLGKGLGFQAVVSAGTALGFFAVVRRLPRSWPAAAAGGAAALTVLLTFIWPLVYEPAFNRFTPVEGPLRERVLVIAERAGVHVGDVLSVDASRRTTRLNAYVSGFGSTKRVVLFDTLLARASPPEIELVVGHELAHEAHGDVLRGTAIGAGGAAAAVLLIWALARGAIAGRAGFAGPGDPAAIPFLAFLLTAAALVTAPAQNAISRRVEASADRAALEYTHDPETAIEVEVRLARENLADLDPNPVIEWAFFSHPAPLRRIEIARAWRAAHPGVAPIDAPSRVP